MMYLFMAIGLLGVALLSMAAFAGHELFGELGERYVTVFSSGLIAVAHLYNQRLCLSKKCAHKS